MSKLERLLNLTAVLLDARVPVTAEAIQAQVPGYPPPGPSFRRAFERDKDDLRVLGIPIRVDKVPGTDPPIDGYRIPPEEYYLADPGLDADELAALHLASMTVRLEGLGEAEGLWKLGGQEEVSVPADAVASIPGDPNLVPVFGAIAQRSPIGFDYRGERRTVEPWRLDFQRGRWYLSGFDRARDGERNFRLDRIEGEVVVLDDEAGFERPATDSPGRTRQGWELGEDAPVTVELLVDAERAAFAERHFDDAVASRPAEGGGTVFEIPVVNEAAFRGFVLGFLEHAEILGPPDVRERMTAWLDDVIAGAGEGGRSPW